MSLTMPFRFFLILFLLSSPVWGQEELKAYLDSVKNNAKISLIIQDLDGTQLYMQGSHHKVPSASIIKIPILYTLFSQAEEGKVSLEEQFVLTQEDIVGGSGELQHQPVGTSFSLEYLAREMIRISDNTATNMIIKRIGLFSVNNKMDELGLETTRLNRLMMDFEAIAAGRQNYTSPAEMNSLLLLLYSSSGLSERLQQGMIEMLLDCADHATIRSQLPSGLNVAHKTGTLDYVRGDAGIIFSPTPLVISIFVEDFSSTEEAEEIIGTVARLAYETYGIEE